MLGYQGYRANVVAYAIAKLSHHVGRAFDWDAIWHAQAVNGPQETALRQLLIGVRSVIVAPQGSRNITEWCKRPQCWDDIRALPCDVGIVRIPRTATEVRGSTTEDPIIEALVAVPAPVWFAASKWAKDTGSLYPWQRALSYSLGTRRHRGGDRAGSKRSKAGSSC